MLGPLQLAAAFTVVLVVLGPQKAQDLGRQLGKAMRELKKAKDEFTHSFNSDDDFDLNSEPSNYDYRRYDEPAALPPAEDEVKVSVAKVGDFSAAAFSDSTDDYGVQSSQQPAKTVPRSK